MAQVGSSKKKAKEATSTGAVGTAGRAGTTPPRSEWNGESAWAASPARLAPDALAAIGGKGRDASWGGYGDATGGASWPGAAEWEYGGASWWSQYPCCGNPHAAYGARITAPQSPPEADQAWKGWMLQRECARWDGSPWVGWGHS